MLIIKETYPPNWEDIKKILKEIPATACFTFGTTLHNPSGNPLDMPLLVHEQLHSEQQGKNPTLWWRRYLLDPAFRAAQEIPATQLQYREIKKSVKDPNELNRFLYHLARDLSSAMYGNIITHTEAMQAIRSSRLFEFKVI